MFLKQVPSDSSNAYQIVLGNHYAESIFSDENSWPDTDNFQHKMMAVDSQSYMADDILVKIDRAAMWNSLETRAPYLDHKLFIFHFFLKDIQAIYVERLKTPNL